MTKYATLSKDTLVRLHAAAIDTGIDRRALLAGLERVAVDFATIPDLSGQLLYDLHQLNGLCLNDDSWPIRDWLTNAIALTRVRREQVVFVRALQDLGTPTKSRHMTPVDAQLRRPIQWTVKKWWGQRQAEVEVSLAITDCYRALLVAGNSVDHWRIVSLTTGVLRWDGIPLKRSWGHDVVVSLETLTSSTTRVQFELTQYGHVVGEDEWEVELRLLMDPLNRHLLPALPGMVPEEGPSK